MSTPALRRALARYARSQAGAGNCGTGAGGFHAGNTCAQRTYPRTWTEEPLPGGGTRHAAEGATVDVVPDPDQPGDWRVEIHEADEPGADLVYVGGEAASSRPEARRIARGWRQRLDRAPGRIDR